MIKSNFWRKRFRFIIFANNIIFKNITTSVDKKKLQNGNRGSTKSLRSSLSSRLRNSLNCFYEDVFLIIVNESEMVIAIIQITNWIFGRKKKAENETFKVSLVSPFTVARAEGARQHFVAQAAFCAQLQPGTSCLRGISSSSTRRWSGVSSLFCARSALSSLLTTNSVFQ